MDIDERFDDDDRDDSGEDSGPDDYYNPNGQCINNSDVRAPKPKPLDQNFVPQQDQKYFSVTIGYPAMRAALRARGYIEVKSFKRIQQIAGYTSSPG